MGKVVLGGFVGLADLVAADVGVWSALLLGFRRAGR
jgi:hypothetical protein